MLSEQDKETVHRVLYGMTRRDIKSFAAFFIMPEEEFEYAVSALRKLRNDVRNSLRETNPSKQE